MTQPKTAAAATSASTTPLLTPTRSSMSPMRSSFISPCAKRPTSTAMAAPTAAASVGVAMPPMIEPIITTGTLRSEEHTSELQSRENLVCRLLLEKKKKQKQKNA